MGRGRHNKGVAIDIVVIDENGRMTVTSEDGIEIHPSRQERSVLANYQADDYEEQVKHIFCNPNIIGEEFRVVLNGRYVYGKYVK